MTAPCQKAFTYAFLLLLLSACGSQMPNQRDTVRIVETDSTQRRLDGDGSAPAAQRAYLLDGALHIEAHIGDETAYQLVRHDASATSDEAAVAPLPSGPHGAPTVLLIEDLPAHLWMPDKGRQIPVFAPEYWSQILRTAQVAVTPTDRRYGAVVNVLNEQD